MNYYSLVTNKPFTEKTVITEFPNYTLISISESESLIKYSGANPETSNWVGSTEITLNEYLSRGGV